MWEIGLTHYLTVAAILFTIGVFGIFLNRKNVIIILMSVELILLSSTSTWWRSPASSRHGGAGVRHVRPDRRRGGGAIGLAILVVYFRNRGSIAVEDLNVMKG